MQNAQSNAQAIKPATEYLASIRNNQHTGLINPEDVIRVQEQLMEQSSLRSALSLDWKEMGPDNFGGRTRAIIYDNRDGASKTIYAAAVSGGIWKSVNGGITWKKVNQAHSNLNISCMQQASNGDIYVGTGESFAAETTSGLGQMGYTGGFMGQGVFKSSDGENFTLLEATAPAVNDDQSDWAYVNELAIDNDKNRIYAATNTGLNYSNDNGNSWKVAKYNHDTLLTVVNRVYEIKCDSFEVKNNRVKVFNPDTISTNIDTTIMTKHFELPFKGNAFDVQVNNDGTTIASVNNWCYISNSSEEIYTNASTFPINHDFILDDSTFTTNNLIVTSPSQSDTSYLYILRNTSFLTNDDDTKLPSEGIGRIEFAIAPSDPNVIYASIAGFIGDLVGVYKTDDKGANWRLVMPATPTTEPFFGQGIYDNAITVFPSDPNRVLLGGRSLWEGKQYSETGFYSWKTVSEGFSGPLFPTYLHFDHHTYVFKPGSDNVFYVGTDGGVAEATYAQEEYTFKTNNRNYFTTQFYAVALSGKKNYVLGGAQDNGTISIPGNGNTIEEGFEIFRGDGGPCAISLIQPDKVVITSTKGVVKRSEDAGINYSTDAQFLDNGTIANKQAFKTPIALWESFHNENSRDSVWYFSRTTIQPGTTIQVRSNNSGQPFYYTTPDDVTLHDGDSIHVRDMVSSVLFLPVANTVWMTWDLHLFDQVPEWFTISNSDYGFNGTPQCIAYSSNANHIFIGTKEGRLFRISNLALAYNYELADVNSPECIVSTQEIPLVAPGTKDRVSQVITSIAVDPQNDNNVMITLGNYGNENYVLYSSNALDQVPVFESRQGNLPQMPVYSSIIEMKDSKIAIIGTEYGIFTTKNIQAASPEWAADGENMNRVPVFDLKQQIVSKEYMEVRLVNGNEITIIPYPGTNNYGAIYAATYGRGLFRSDNYFLVGVDDNKIDQPSVSTSELKFYPNPVSSKATVEIELNKNTEVEFIILDLNGRQLSKQIRDLSKGINKISFDMSRLLPGVYFIQSVSDGDIRTKKFIVK